MKLTFFWWVLGLISTLSAQAELPNVVIISVDTLRADRLSFYGYARATSPNIDRLLASGMVFDQARTVEPLTAPALASMLTSLHPHQHGVTRNGVSIYENLPSLGKKLQDRGYLTAAFVGNWTLKHGLSGLGEHFEEYHEILNKKRWFGLFLSESNAEDITRSAVSWLKKSSSDRPFFLWVHYTDPHAPYNFQREFAAQLGLKEKGNHSRSDRYDTEVAFTDHHINLFLQALKQHSKPENTLIVFTSDHGESLGEHGYWGHGRNLYEATLHIPLAFTWPGHIPAGHQNQPALLFDVAPTVLGLLKINVPLPFKGLDWSPVFLGEKQAPQHRITFYQAHKGAVQTKRGVQRGRQKGLLEVALIAGGIKELFRVKSRALKSFDLFGDPKELSRLNQAGRPMSQLLKQWALEVEKGLNRAMERQGELSDRDVEMLRSLGYIE